MFGGWGAGNTIGLGGNPSSRSSLIIIGPGVFCGMIIGGEGGNGWGIEITIDGGGPDGMKIGGGLRDFFGKLM